MKITTAKTSELIPYAKNAKLHPDWQVKQIAASIQEFGMNDPIAVWHDKNGTPIIVEGHGRVLALEKLGIEECPTISLDNLSDEQRRAYTLVHNKLTMNTDFDMEMLESELLDLAPDIDLTQYELHVTMPDEMGEEEDSVDNIDDSQGILITAESDEDLENKFNRLTKEGYKCKIITI